MGFGAIFSSQVISFSATYRLPAYAKLAEAIKRAVAKCHENHVKNMTKESKKKAHEAISAVSASKLADDFRQKIRAVFATPSVAFEAFDFKSNGGISVSTQECLCPC